LAELLATNKRGLRMIRQPVTSSNIREVGYDAASQTLEILFHSGAVYQYSGVPDSVYRALMEAASHGSYFHTSIRDTYPYRRIQ
jgi:hypothetical protein